MPGFYGVIGSKEVINNNIDIQSDLIYDSLICNDLYIERKTVNKFLSDKIFCEDDKYFVLTEGVILNKKELLSKYKGKDLFETAILMYEKQGESFFNEFRGSFSGVFYDKKRDKKIIYTGHIGDKQVFYSQTPKGFIFGSDVNYIIKFYKANNLDYTLNTNAAYQLLTFGFLLEDNTLIDKINKLIAGHYIVFENNSDKIKQYYRLENTPDYKQTEEEVIENIDRLFRQAIKRAFDKDLEYGYKHLVALSGGLDSRMTTWVANDMGYGENIVNYTFSQSDYLDEIIPKKIASALKHEWVFKSLDNGLFLKNIENVVELSGGAALYYGLSHGKSCLDLIDNRKFGIIHTGMLGDVIVGTFYSTLDKSKEYSLFDGAYSKLLANRLNEIKIKGQYDNEEIYKFYGRGFTGANQGLLVAQEVGETYSPFYDLDFIEYCLKIPVEKRFGHQIYKKWMNAKYPDSTKYKWEKINARINDRLIRVRGVDIPLRRLHIDLPKYVLRKLKIIKPQTYTPNHMNPLDYWYYMNKDLRDFMDNYYKDNIEKISFSPSLKDDCKKMFTEGTNIEKNQVLTLLASMKLFLVKINDK